jgi:hypothetical protein
MTNPNLSQRDRSLYNPLFLGKFSQTSLRLLQGTLGPRSELIGGNVSGFAGFQGGYGRETYNNWFKVELTSPAWIILVKAGSVLPSENGIATRNIRNNTNSRYKFGVYDINRIPIEGRSIIENPFEFRGQAEGNQADLYNTYNFNRQDKGDDRFFKLEAGSYLICISAVRNELFEYAAGLVIEFQQPSDDIFILTEDNEQSFLLQEGAGGSADASTFEELFSPITSNTVVDEFNAFTENDAEVVDNIEVQINNRNLSSEQLAWLIGSRAPNEPGQEDVNRILLDATPNWVDTIRERSLSDWRNAWNRENADKFPEAVFAPYVNTQ